MNLVKGKNVVCAMKVGSDYLPVFCAKTAELVLEQDEIEVTSVNSGSDREYEPGMANQILSCTGITPIDNTEGKLSPNYLRQTSVRRVVQILRITMTDDDGDVVVIDCSAIIKRVSIQKETTAYSQSAVDFRITGGTTSTTVLPPNIFGSGVLYLATTPAATSVTSATLIGKTILLVEREGVGYDETTGTPGNRQFVFNSGTGALTFLVGFDVNERVHVIYE